MAIFILIAFIGVLYSVFLLWCACLFKTYHGRRFRQQPCCAPNDTILRRRYFSFASRSAVSITTRSWLGNAPYCWHSPMPATVFSRVLLANAPATIKACIQNARKARPPWPGGKTQVTLSTAFAVTHELDEIRLPLSTKNHLKRDRLVLFNFPCGIVAGHANRKMHLGSRASANDAANFPSVSSPVTHHYRKRHL
jgi:hypothetical protein